MLDPIKLKQGGTEWLQYRLGKLTGSRLKDALSFLKSGQESAARYGYKVELVCERMTDSAAEHYVSPEMEWGTSTEPLARAAYEMREGVDVDIVGISQHPSIEGFMASCDGYVGTDGVAEFKCPKTATHVKWMLANEVPEEHALQMYAELACSGRAYCDFVSYDPRLPLRHQLFIKRLYADPKIISMIEDGARTFLAEVDAMIEALNARNPEVEPAPRKDYGELGITDEDLAYLL